MSDDKKFTMFEGLSWDSLKDSDDPVSDAIKTVADRGGAAGAILNHALGLTGSDGKAFSEAVQSYSNAYNPLFSKMLDALQDDKVRSELIDRLAKNQHVVNVVRKERGE